MTDRRPLHLCLVANTAWSIYHYRQGLLLALRARGVTVTVIAPRDRAFTSLTALGCRCIDLKVASQGTNPLADLGLLRTLYRHYKALKPDLVFHYTIKPNIYGSVAARLAGVRSVAVTTGLGYVFIRDGLTARVAKNLYRFAFRFPGQVWFLNADDHRAFVDARLLAHPDRARVLHGEGVDLEHFAVKPVALAKPRVDFILIGRMLWDKGVAEYIDAARRLRGRYPEARWQLLGPVGVANPAAIGQADIDAWAAEPSIDYLGTTEDVRPFIEQADCVVLPSYAEGMPRTLLEALAIGRPIIATDAPGCRETVDEGRTGFLCRPRDAEDLAAQMARILDLGAAGRMAMGRHARAKAEAEFDEGEVVQRYLGTIAALTEHEPTTRRMA